MSNDFMDGMFDFNGDGHTDAGEEFMAYKIYEDCTKDSEPAMYQFTPRAKKMDGFDIFMILLIAYAVLNTICDWIY